MLTTVALVVIMLQFYITCTFVMESCARAELLASSSEERVSRTCLYHFAFLEKKSGSIRKCRLPLAMSTDYPIPQKAVKVILRYAMVNRYLDQSRSRQQRLKASNLPHGLGLTRIRCVQGFAIENSSCLLTFLAFFGSGAVFHLHCTTMPRSLRADMVGCGRACISSCG